MAIYRLYPKKDTFIYSEIASGSAGEDEIVELGSYRGATGQFHISRILVSYDNALIINTINSELQGRLGKAELNYKVATGYGLLEGTYLESYPLSKSFKAGRGKFGDSPIDKSGTSWAIQEPNLDTSWDIQNYNTLTTGSWQTELPGGGEWYTGSALISNVQTTASYDDTSSNADLDIKFDITKVVQGYYSGSIVNNGHIIKLDNTTETNESINTRIKYYGNNTNTIYRPYLDLKRDDFTYEIGTLSVLSVDTATISLIGNKGVYSVDSKQRFRFNARPKYPAPTYSTGSIYLENHALPATSCWGIKDEVTGEMVVSFDPIYTRISADSIGSYCDIYMNVMYPERYYNFLIKYESAGSTTVIDYKHVFKVVQNE
jgi:hypothetical protein